AEHALVLADRNLFTAHEFVQMVPIWGLETYERMCELNAWTKQFLPNAVGPPQQVAAVTPRFRPVRRLTEAALPTPVGNAIERWEMDRKIRQFSRKPADYKDDVFSQAETTFNADCCKGHFEAHGQRILAEYSDRLRSIAIHGR